MVETPDGSSYSTYEDATDADYRISWVTIPNPDYGPSGQGQPRARSGPARLTAVPGRRP